MARIPVRNGYVKIPPVQHQLPASTDVGALITALEGKADYIHSHEMADVTGLTGAIAGKADTGAFAEVDHGHLIADVTGLQSALDGKQASGSYAAASHAHIIADVTGLQTALDGKQASGSYAAASHSHVAADITDFAAEVTALLSGGSDPWTNVLLGSDFTNSTTSNNNVTGLAFTPNLANTRYLVECYLFVKSAATTTGVRPGIAWPTGLSYQGAKVETPNSATASILRFFGSTATANAAATGIADTTNFYLARISAYFRTGASPSGNFQITVASEIAASLVTVGANSLLMWRTV